MLAFTALRLELTWQRRAVDTYVVDQLVGKAEANLPKGQEFL